MLRAGEEGPEFAMSRTGSLKSPAPPIRRTPEPIEVEEPHRLTPRDGGGGPVCRGSGAGGAGPGRARLRGGAGGPGLVGSGMGVGAPRRTIEWAGDAEPGRPTDRAGGEGPGHAVSDAKAGEPGRPEDVIVVEYNLKFEILYNICSRLAKCNDEMCFTPMSNKELMHEYEQ